VITIDEVTVRYGDDVALSGVCGEVETANGSG
jgi:hypothetical protein